MVAVVGHGTWCAARHCRWIARCRRHLESGSVGAQGQQLQSVRFDAHELEGLPAPVQRYFHAVLTEGQPIIAAATIVPKTKSSRARG